MFVNSQNLRSQTGKGGGRGLDLHVELDHVLAEEDVSDEEALHTSRRRLHARLLCLFEEPRGVGNLKGATPDGDPERCVLVP